MSATTQPATTNKLDEQRTIAEKEDRPITYIPLGETVAISLTISQVKKFIGVKTKQGKEPSTDDCVKFLMLCKAQLLNPWVGDAFLIGYDGTDGPTFSLITAQQALLKRAEQSPQYNGMTSGVIVSTQHEKIDAGRTLIRHREGAVTYDGEKLVGGWAEVFRKDRGIPQRAEVRLETYHTGRSQWKKDATGMIVKVAESAALRKAFPTQLGGLTVHQAETEQETAIDVPMEVPPGPADCTITVNQRTPRPFTGLPQFYEETHEGEEPDSGSDFHLGEAVEETHEQFERCTSLFAVKELCTALLDCAQDEVKPPTLDAFMGTIRMQALNRADAIRDGRGSGSNEDK